jgi:succinate dehydrogenase flavin-adding protein (antitoxin of CptAB toxin-antitoxin module)
MNDVSSLILVVSAISGLAIVALLIFAVIKSKNTNPSENTSKVGGIDDELVYDEITGKYVTVEELMEMQELDVLTEEKIEQEYASLSDELKSKISVKDFELIMEFEQHFNIIKSREDIDDESKYEMLSDILKRKGKSIDLTLLKQIIS